MKPFFQLHCNYSKTVIPPSTAASCAHESLGAIPMQTATMLYHTPEILAYTFSFIPYLQQLVT